jgi:hypothetical protein
VIGGICRWRIGDRYFFEFVADPANRLQTLTLPFEGGLELIVKS